MFEKSMIFNQNCEQKNYDINMNIIYRKERAVIIIIFTFQK